MHSDLAMRRHWTQVCCAFSFCWWALTQNTLRSARTAEPGLEVIEANVEASATVEAGSEKNRPPRPAVSWPVALRRIRAWLEPFIMLRRYWQGGSNKPPPAALQQLLDRLREGEGINVYIH